MLKKFSIYLLLFSIIFIVNIYFLLKINSRYKKQAHIQQILKDITFNNSPEKQFNFSSAPFVLGAYESEVNVVDNRVANLKSFFRKYGSSLYDQAELIVKVSDKYNFDYRLLPAIAMQESNLCKYIPSDSYNCWGWGIYGDLVTRFESYEEAIETVAKGIKNHYIDKGLVTASSIMEKYTPSSNGSWAHGVNIFLKMLE